METFYEVSCCIEAPDDYSVKAKYALTMLLMPLGLQPKWVQRDALTDTGIYYGPSWTTVQSHVLRIPLHRETLHYFQNRSPYAVSKVLWRIWEKERWPVLFSGPGVEEEDLIASAFFWLSGWQEYTVSRRDFHGRFPYEASLQAALGIGALPCVDAYREQFSQALREKGIRFTQKTWSGREWAFCPTHDIDYMRKWRPGMIVREAVHYLLLNHLQYPFSRRLRRFGDFLIDLIKPGDAFRDALTRIIYETDLREGTGTYFFKTDAHGPQDVYYSISGGFVKHVISKLNDLEFEVGLHPSYFAYNHKDYLQHEKRKLESVTNQPIKAVRQHYLRYEERTSRLHVQEGFFIDSTLAFANKEGFRRGTCLPFKLFDIREE